MNKIPLFISIVVVLSLFGCKATEFSSLEKKDYLGYQPIDAIPSSKVKVYDSSQNLEKMVYWESITDPAVKRKLLPLQSAKVSVSKTEQSGEVTYPGAAITAERGTYEVVMDFMKYRVEDFYDADSNYIGNNRVGVGLRITAAVTTSKADLNVGSLTAIGLAAKQSKLTGSIAVDIIGIDSENVTNLIPLTSEIDQTSIQSALQALATIKSKLWEGDTELTPHIVAIKQNVPGKEAELRQQVAGSTYVKTDSGELLRNFWKPNGEINQENQKALEDWINEKRPDTNPGGLVMFLRSAEFESLREAAVEDLIK